MAGLRFNIHAQDKTKSAFNSVRNNVRATKSRFASLKGAIKGMGPLIAGAFAGAAIRAIIDITDKVQKFALVTGITTEALSELKFAGEQSGVEFDKLQVAIRKTGKSVSDANRGLATQVDALADLGLTSQELIALPLDDQFQIIGDKLRGVTNQSDKLRISMDIMGRSGSELIAMFDNNAESVAELRQELRYLGGVIEQDQADALAGLNDAWNRIKTAFQGVVRVILTALAPALELLMNIISELIAFISKTIRTVFLLDDAFAAIIGTVGNLFGVLDDGVKDRSLDNLGDKWDSIWDSTKKSTKAAKEYRTELGKLGNTKTTPKGPKKGDILKKETLTDAERQAQRTMDRIGDTFKGGIGDVIRDFDNLGDVVKNTFSKIGDLLLENSIDQLLGGLGGGGGKSGGGGFDIFGSIGDLLTGGGGGGGASSGGGGFDIFGSIASAFGGFFAEGGAFNAGKPIVVGEKGPELIMPRSAGTVVPNDQLGGGGVNVVMNIQTPDVSSFRESQAQIAVGMASQIEIAQRRNM